MFANSSLVHTVVAFVQNSVAFVYTVVHIVCIVVPIVVAFLLSCPLLELVGISDALELGYIVYLFCVRYPCHQLQV